MYHIAIGMLVDKLVLLSSGGGAYCSELLHNVACKFNSMHFVPALWNFFLYSQISFYLTLYCRCSSCWATVPPSWGCTNIRDLLEATLHISTEFAEVQCWHPNQPFAHLQQQNGIQGLFCEPGHAIQRRPWDTGPSHYELQNRCFIPKRLPFPTRRASQGETIPHPGVPPWHCRWRYSGYRVEDLELPEDICRPCTVHPRKCSPESRWRYIKGGRRPSSSWMLLKPSTLLCFRSPSEVPDTWETPSLAVQLLFLQDQTWLQNKSWRRVVWR